MSDGWVSVSEAAEIAGRDPETVRRAIRSGELEARRFGARGWYSVNARGLESLIVKSRKGDAAGGAAGISDQAKAG